MTASTLCENANPPLVAMKRQTLNYEMYVTNLRENKNFVIVNGPNGYVKGSIMSS